MIRQSAPATSFYGAARSVAANPLTPTLALLILLVASPLLATPLPPLADYLNHLGRMNVLAHIGTDPDLARLWEIDWAIVPNLALDLIVPPLTRLMDLYQAGALFNTAAIVLLATGPLALQRALFGRVSVWPLLGFPFVYNEILLFGLMNYLFGVGLALWAAAGWIMLRDRQPWLRAAVSLPAVLLLFASHLFALGVYGMILLAVEIWRVAEGRNGTARLGLGDAAALLLPFLPAGLLLLAGPTAGLSTEIVWAPYDKLDGIYSAFRTYSAPVDVGVVLGAAALFLWAMERRLLRMHPAGWWLLAVSTVVYLAMPRMLFGSWMADQRLPTAALFALLGCIRFSAPNRAVPVMVCAALLGLTAVRSVEVQAAWRTLAPATAEMRRTLDLVDRGSAILVAHADRPAGTGMEQVAISHAPCLAMIERSALVSTAFSVKGKQVLGVKPDYRGLVDPYDGDPPTVQQLRDTPEGTGLEGPRYWDAWAERYDYLFVLYTVPGGANPDPDHLQLLHDGTGFQLYAVLPDDEGDDED